MRLLHHLFGTTKIKQVVFLLVFTSLASAQFYEPPNDPEIQIGHWRVSDEPVNFNTPASISHFIASAYIANVLDDHMAWWQADLSVITFGLLWEIKDGYVPWERAGFLGGEGFSANDLELGVLGVTVNRALPSLIDMVFPDKKRSKRSNVSLKFSGWSTPKLSLQVSL